MHLGRDDRSAARAHLLEIVENRVSRQGAELVGSQNVRSDDDRRVPTCRNMVYEHWGDPQVRQSSDKERGYRFKRERDEARTLCRQHDVYLHDPLTT
jgi:hypothetical protein